MSLSIRLLKTKDLDAADEIVQDAYRLQFSRREELQRYLELQPDGWLFAEIDGIPVGLVGAIDYGPFSYIGLMSVSSSMQRRGIASALLEQLLYWLEQRNCPTVLLDASSDGENLYRRFGFIEEDKTAQMTFPELFDVESLADFTRQSKQDSEQVTILQQELLPALISFDAAHFGVKRAHVLSSYLEEHPERTFLTHDPAGRITGYIHLQQQRIGPWIATNSKSAELLLRQALALPFSAPPQVLTAVANSDAIDLLRRYGFRSKRTLSHMRYGQPLVRQRATTIYGQVSYALG